MFKQKFFKTLLALLLAGHSFVSTATNYYAEEVIEQEMSVLQEEKKVKQLLHLLKIRKSNYLKKYLMNQL